MKVESHEQRSNVILKKVVQEYQISYLSSVELHANLMLDTMSREQINYSLEVAYPFTAPENFIADLRAALNAEMLARK